MSPLCNAAEDGVPTGKETPDYVHRLLDALMRHEPLDFQGAVVPEDVQARLSAFFEARTTLSEDKSIADSDAMHQLLSNMAASVHAELWGNGTQMTAGSDESWLRVALGITEKMKGRQVGWFLPLNPRAYHFVPVTSFPDSPPTNFSDENEWIPLFAFGE